MMPAPQTSGGWRTSSQQVDASRPSASGARPRLKAASARSKRGRRERRETKSGKTSAGAIKPIVVASAPAAPAICQPITVTKSMLGPGAACARAIELTNCVCER